MPSVPEASRQVGAPSAVTFSIFAFFSGEQREVHRKVSEERPKTVHDTLDKGAALLHGVRAITYSDT